MDGPVRVPWTEDMALRMAGVDKSAPRAEQVQTIREAVDDDRLFDQAVDALIAAGWVELDFEWDEPDAPERGVRGGYEFVPVTAEMALRTGDIDTRLPRDQQLEQMRQAIEDEKLPHTAVAALVDAGWVELGGEATLA